MAIVGRMGWTDYLTAQMRSTAQGAYDGWETGTLTLREYVAGGVAVLKEQPRSLRRLLGLEGGLQMFSDRLINAREAFSERTSQARASDRGKLAPLTVNYEKWRKNPSKWDFPGVDTPRDADLSDRLPDLGWFGKK
jgi:hypothetical protein